MLASKAFKMVPKTLNSPKEWSYREMKVGFYCQNLQALRVNF